MPHTRGNKSSSHVEWLHYNNDILGEHDDDIHKEHNYFHGEFESQCMFIGSDDTFVIQL
jgi:hypothetical protein